MEKTWDFKVLSRTFTSALFEGVAPLYFANRSC